MKKQIKLSAKSENICKNLTKKVKIFINAADFAKCSAARKRPYGQNAVFLRFARKSRSRTLFTPQGGALIRKNPDKICN